MPCQQKDRCGSCRWSHIPYEKQLKQKLSDINGSFALKKLPLTCDSILPCPQTEHYRNRMDFVIDFEGRVGMRERGKWWRVIDDHTCFLADERIENHFSHVREWTKVAGLSFFDRKAHTGLLRYAVIRSTSTGETLINIITSSTDDKESVRKALTQLADLARPTTLIWTTNATVSDVSFGEVEEVISGPGYLQEIVGGVTYRISPQAFFQTNLYSTPILQKTVLDAIPQDAERILDLYCGSGFFSLPLAKKGFSVHGVELNASAIEDAKWNAKQNNIDSITFEAKKAETVSISSYQADTVIVDPPRSGMHDKALADLIEARPQNIIYVSCSYKNLARELVLLTESYSVVDMIAVDMFPHTPHVEIVVTLKRM